MAELGIAPEDRPSQLPEKKEEAEEIIEPPAEHHEREREEQTGEVWIRRRLGVPEPEPERAARPAAELREERRRERLGERRGRPEEMNKLLKYALYAGALVLLWYFVSAPVTVFEGGSVRHLPPGSRLGSWYLPFIGETLDFVRNPFKFGLDRAKNYGPVAYSDILWQDTIVMSGHAMRAFYNTSLIGRRGAYPENIVELTGGEVLPMLDEPAHSKRREWIEKAFQPGFIEEYISRVDAQVQEAIERWTLIGRFHWVDEFRSLASRIVGSLVVSDAAQGAAQQHHFQQVIDALNAIPSALPFSQYQRGINARDELLRWYAEHAYRIERTGGGLEMMRLLQPEYRGSNISYAGALRELHFVGLSLYAMHNSLAFMVQAISQHADVWRRAKAEVASVSSKGPITLEQLQQMTYLSQVIDEVRRFYPIYPGMFGYVKKSFMIDGYVLPADWLVYASIYATNHDPSLYRNPHIFDPSRFYEHKEPIGGRKYGYCPQGAGEPGATGHRCSGEDFTTNIMKLVLTHLLRGYSWALPPQNLSPRTDMLLPVPSSGLMVHSFERNEQPITAEYIRD